MVLFWFWHFENEKNLQNLFFVDDEKENKNLKGK
jgi:hypothetical protein